MKHQRGAALLVILMIVGVLGAFFALRALSGLTAERDKVTAAALAQAKDALIGYAVTYRDTHPTEVNGNLLVPDMGSTRNTTTGEGVTAGNFFGNASNVSVVGRLPWRTLGLAALRDSSGGCLWYAVSGAYQNAQPTTFMNWDTLGQFDVFTSNGTSLGTISTVGSTNYHQRPVAVIFAPGAALVGQVRGPIGADTVAECGGNYATQNYLDAVTPSPLVNNIVNYLMGTNNATGVFTLAAPKQILAGSVVDATGNTLVNDRMLSITADELFGAIRRRNDFSGFVNNQLLGIAATNIAALPAPTNKPATLDFTPTAPTETPGGTIVGGLEIGRVPQAALTATPLKRWQDNLLYAKCVSGASCLTVNGSSCTGVVIFAGERTAAQTRATNAQKNNWSNYLEGSILAAFTSGTTTFTGPSAYSAVTPTSDVLACIATLPSTTQAASFAANFGSFITKGSGVTTDSVAKTVTIAPAAGSAGGCFWSPTEFGLARKTLRAYYEFAFTTGDTFALTSIGADHGNGFSMQMVTGQFGVQPSTCGTEINMGVLDSVDVWGHDSFIFETDVHRDAAAHADPFENHSAILLNGFLDHAPLAAGATISTACDGTAAGCRHSPANKFEEAPPQIHNQRLEVHTGCNATCTVCNPPAHSPPNSYARITAWVDCKDCNNVATDINRTTSVPTIQRCVALNPVMNTVFFGFTGGFRSGANQQGVTVNNLILRSE